VDLPDDDPLEGKENTIEPPMGKIMSALGKYDVYSEVFDPVYDKEAITSTISDDLSDIYTDLKRPLFKYDSGEKPAHSDLGVEVLYENTLGPSRSRRVAPDS